MTRFVSAESTQGFRASGPFNEQNASGSFEWVAIERPLVMGVLRDFTTGADCEQSWCIQLQALFLEEISIFLRA